MIYHVEEVAPVSHSVAIFSIPARRKQPRVRININHHHVPAGSFQGVGVEGEQILTARWQMMNVCLISSSITHLANKSPLIVNVHIWQWCWMLHFSFFLTLLIVPGNPINLIDTCRVNLILICLTNFRYRCWEVPLAERLNHYYWITGCLIGYAEIYWHLFYRWMECLHRLIGLN